MHIVNALWLGLIGVVWGPLFLCALFIAFCESWRGACQRTWGEPNEVTDELALKNIVRCLVGYSVAYLVFMIPGVVFASLVRPEKLAQQYFASRSVATAVVFFRVLSPPRTRSTIGDVIGDVISLLTPTLAIFFTSSFVYGLSSLSSLSFSILSNTHCLHHK